MSLTKQEDCREFVQDSSSGLTIEFGKGNKSDELKKEFEKLSQEAHDRQLLKRFGQSDPKGSKKDLGKSRRSIGVVASSTSSSQKKLSTFVTKDMELFDGIEVENQAEDSDDNCDTIQASINSLLQEIEDLNTKIMNADPSDVPSLRSQLDALQHAFEALKQEAFIASSIEGGDKMRKQSVGDGVKSKDCEPLLVAFERYKKDLSDRSRELLKKIIHDMTEKYQTLKALEDRLNHLLDLMQEIKTSGRLDLFVMIHITWFIHLAHRIDMMDKKDVSDDVTEKAFSFIRSEPRLTEAIRVCYLAYQAETTAISSLLHTLSMTESKEASELREKEGLYRLNLVEKKRMIQCIERTFPSLKTESGKKIWTTKKDLTLHSVNSCETESKHLKEICSDMKSVVEILTRFRAQEKEDGASRKELASIDLSIKNLNKHVQECESTLSECETYIGLLTASEGSCIGEAPHSLSSDSTTDDVVEKGFKYSTQTKFDAPLNTVIYVPEDSWIGPTVIHSMTPLTRSVHHKMYNSTPMTAMIPQMEVVPGYFKVDCGKGVEEWVSPLILNAEVHVNPSFYEGTMIGLPNPLSTSHFELRSGLLVSKTDPTRDLPILLTLESGVVLTARPFFPLYMSLKIVKDSSIPSGFGVTIINGKKSKLSYALLRGRVIPPVSSFKLSGSNVFKRSDGSFSYPNLTQSPHMRQTPVAPSSTESTHPLLISHAPLLEGQTGSVKMSSDGHQSIFGMTMDNGMMIQHGHVYMSIDKVVEKDGGVSII